MKTRLINNFMLIAPGKFNPSSVVSQFRLRTSGLVVVLFLSFCTALRSPGASDVSSFIYLLTIFTRISLVGLQSFMAIPILYLFYR